MLRVARCVCLMRHPSCLCMASFRGAFTHRWSLKVETSGNDNNTTNTPVPGYRSTFIAVDCSLRGFVRLLLVDSEAYNAHTTERSNFGPEFVYLAGVLTVTCSGCGFLAVNLALKSSIHENPTQPVADAETKGSVGGVGE